MRKILLAVTLIALALLLLGTASAAVKPDGFYLPDGSENDWDSPFSNWSFKRSRSSEHFIVFWAREFGEDPMNSDKPVDVDKMLRRAEVSWRTNVDRLGMITAGEGLSRLDTYKFQVYLLYTDEWVAQTSCFDNVISYIEISPSAVNIDGCSFAHEIGHCFQFQIYSDALLNGAPANRDIAFRYDYPGGYTNSFWEQCAQWVSYLDYPEEAATDDEFGSFGSTSNLSFEHEWTEYQSYWFLIYLTEHYGADLIARIWKECTWPETALSVLTRLQYAGDVERLNDDLYDYAASIAAGQLLPAGTPSLAKRFTTHLYRIDGDWRQVGYRSCPGIGGFNIVSLPLNTSSVTFEGLQPGSSLAPDDPGEWRTGADGDKVGGVTANYNTTLVKPGWRWGLVVAMKDGSAQKFPMHSEASGTVSVEVPDDADGLYLVVLGAPGVQCYNPQDYDESNDLQFPYRFKVTKN